MFVNQEERTILDTLGVPPDVRIYPDSVQNRIDFFHRQTGGEDIYFLYNRDSAAVDMDVQFRIHNRQPEFWDAVTGSTVAVAVYIDAGEGVRLPVYLPGHGSIFVVFTEDRIEAPHITSVRHAGMQLFPTESTAPLSFSAMYENNGRLIIEGRKSGIYDLVLSNGEQRSVNVEEPVAAVELNGPWEVHFPAGWGAQTVQTFDSLHSWTDAEDAGTRVFSGIAVYRNTFTIDTSDWPGIHRATLELGKVKEVAHVMLNGQDVGLSSFTPHSLDVTDHIRHGENFLTVEVANTWLNRLIADDRLPPEARLTHTNLVNGPTSDRPWRMAVPKPSGLLGPVIVTIDKPVKLTSH